MNWLSQTLTRKFSLLLVGFLVLQVLQLSIGILGILHVGEQSATLNDAGRQRMRTYHLLFLAHEALESHSWPSEGRKIVDGILADFGTSQMQIVGRHGFLSLSAMPQPAKVLYICVSKSSLSVQMRNV